MPALPPVDAVSCTAGALEFDLIYEEDIYVGVSKGHKNHLWLPIVLNLGQFLLNTQLCVNQPNFHGKMGQGLAQS